MGLDPRVFSEHAYPMTARGSAASKRKTPRLEEDPILDVLEHAPLDDEPLTPDDLRAIENGHKQFERGEYITSEELRRARSR